MKNLPPAILTRTFLDQTALPKKSSIYYILCTANQKLYFGSAVDVRNRFFNHRRSLDKNKHHSIYLQRAYNKYGSNSFVFVVVEFVEQEELIKREQFYIDEYNPEFNMNPVAGSNLGKKFGPETRLKIRNARLGKKLTPEQKAIAVKNLRPQVKGFKHSEKTKQKMSEARKICPPVGMKGKHHTESALQKISKAASKTYRFLSPDKEIVEITNLSEFCEANDLTRFHLYAVHAGKRKSHKGWTKADTNQS